MINKPAQVVCDDKDFDAIQRGFDPSLRQGAMGSIPRFLMANFAETYPTIPEVHKYSTTNFGALNRLDRETSG